MLCSHLKRFIYLKTMKTAGTSTEIFFEKFCCPNHLYQESHTTPEIISEQGIIGYRGADPGQSRFFNHMPAALAKQHLGDTIWQEYFKFCVVRNPFDKVVSMFWMQLPPSKKAFLAEAPFSLVRREFSAWATDPTHLPVDRQTFMINDVIAVDHFIRFETLAGDIDELCRRLAIDNRCKQIPRYKSHHRRRHEGFRAYYDEASAQTVRMHFEWELAHFGYSL